MKTRAAAHFFPVILCLSLAAFPGPATLLAQSGDDSGGGEDTGEDGEKGFWECQSSGGNFVVKLDDITSVSKHTYVVDGAARVYEVTVGTSGPMVGRFYYIEPVTDESPLAIGKITLDRLRQLAEDVTERTGTENVWTEVVKNYPQTTHAKTAEYRVSGIDQIEKIYKHVYKVWALEKGRGSDNKVIAE